MHSDMEQAIKDNTLIACFVLTITFRFIFCYKMVQ